MNSFGSFTAAERFITAEFVRILGRIYYG